MSDPTPAEAVGLRPQVRTTTAYFATAQARVWKVIRKEVVRRMNTYDPSQLPLLQSIANKIASAGADITDPLQQVEIDLTLNQLRMIWSVWEEVTGGLERIA